MKNKPEPSKQAEIEEKISKILGEPATGSRGQGGLPITGSVIDYEMSFTKDGKAHLIQQLSDLLTSEHQRLYEELVEALPEKKNLRPAEEVKYASEIVKLVHAKNYGHNKVVTEVKATIDKIFNKEES